MSWQVQEAKQRFSEVLRAVQRDGPQTITRHGEEIAVVIDISEYRHLTSSRKSLTEVLLDPRTADDTLADVLDEVEAERKGELPRDIDFGDQE